MRSGIHGVQTRWIRGFMPFLEASQRSGWVGGMGCVVSGLTDGPWATEAVGQHAGRRSVGGGAGLEAPGDRDRGRIGAAGAGGYAVPEVGAELRVHPLDPGDDV